MGPCVVRVPSERLGGTVSLDCWCWAGAYSKYSAVTVYRHSTAASGSRERPVSACRSTKTKVTTPMYLCMCNAWGHQAPPTNKTALCRRALIGGLDVAGDGALRVSRPPMGT